MTREEAITVLKKVVNPKVKEAIETLIPELAESEDERIRKSLIRLVEQFMADERKEKTLAWLEKMRTKYGN